MDGITWNDMDVLTWGTPARCLCQGCTCRAAPAGVRTHLLGAPAWGANARMSMWGAHLHGAPMHLNQRNHGWQWTAMNSMGMQWSTITKCCSVGNNFGPTCPLYYESWKSCAMWHWGIGRVWVYDVSLKKMIGMHIVHWCLSWSVILFRYFVVGCPVLSVCGVVLCFFVFFFHKFSCYLVIGLSDVCYVAVFSQSFRFFFVNLSDCCKS